MEINAYICRENDKFLAKIIILLSLCIVFFMVYVGSGQVFITVIAIFVYYRKEIVLLLVYFFFNEIARNYLLILISFVF